MTDEEKQEIIKEIDINTEEELQQYYELVEEGIAKDWICALEVKGYGCYGGNDLYECDWDEAFRCINRLAELTGNACYYNTLGYIYYYGRCNGGVPQYDEAFKCFAIGSACGYFESTYKLADMFEHGYGVPQNYHACHSLTTRHYHETRERFCKGEYGTNFCDVSLRVGGLYEKGIDEDVDLIAAYTYYLEAKAASDLRLMTGDGYGDDRVAQRIDDAIARVEPQLPDNFWMDSIELDTPGPIGDLLSCNSSFDVTLTNTDGVYYLQAEGHETEHTSGCTLITVPNMHYSQLVRKVGLYIKNPTFLRGGKAATEKYQITQIMLNQDTDAWDFICGEQVVLSFKCEGFVFKEKRGGFVYNVF